MIKPYGEIEDEQDPYKGFSDSNQIMADQPPEQPPEQRERDASPPPDEGPKPYTPPTERTVGEEPPPRQPTFAEREVMGEARPPMPEPPEPTYAPPSTSRAMPQIDGSRVEPSPYVPPREPGLPPGQTEGSRVEEYAPPPHVGGAQESSGNDAILNLLTGHASGDKSALAKATEAKAMSRLNGASPYDSKAVRDEYDWLGGNIDDQYAMDTQALDEGMAARGIYGSAGKDFHSGRLSDLNVGKRSAKTALAQDLGNKFATSKGAYDANAVDQAQSVGAQGDAQQRAWLQSLMGYGNDAFNHDLASAEFGQRQNESEQDFLMRMLQMGYGV